MYYLLKGGQLLQDADISKELAETIGWTKLQIIARHLQGDDPSPFSVAELLELALEHKVKDLPTAIRGKTVTPRRAVQFNLSLDARVELNRALVQHGAKEVPKGLIGKEAALMRIVRAAKATKTNG